MPKTIIEQTPNYKVTHHTGITKFRGCQCFKDCSCNEDFKPKPYDYYVVTRFLLNRKRERTKSTIHGTIESLNERLNYIKSLTK